MLFSIIGTDKPDSLKKRQQARQQHLERLAQLDQQQRLVIAGPNPHADGTEGFSGSVIIAQFDSLQAAQDWASQDPYIEADVYDHVEIKPFKQVFPNE